MHPRCHPPSHEPPAPPVHGPGPVPRAPAPRPRGSPHHPSDDTPRRDALRGGSSLHPASAPWQVHRPMGPATSPVRGKGHATRSEAPPGAPRGASDLPSPSSAEQPNSSSVGGEVRESQPCREAERHGCQVLELNAPPCRRDLRAPVSFASSRRRLRPYRGGPLQIQDRSRCQASRLKVRCSSLRPYCEVIGGPYCRSIRRHRGRCSQRAEARGRRSSILARSTAYHHVASPPKCAKAEDRDGTVFRGRDRSNELGPRLMLFLPPHRRGFAKTCGMVHP